MGERNELNNLNRVRELSDKLAEAEKRAETVSRNAEAVLDQWRGTMQAAEKRASEAERTFADLRNLIAVNLAANAELVRRAETLQADLMRRHLCFECDAELEGPYCPKCNPIDDNVPTLRYERDSARAALGKVVEALKDVRAWFSGNTVRSEKAMRPLIEQIDTALISYGE